MPPDLNLKDKPSAGKSEQQNSSDELARAGTERLDPAAQKKMGPSNNIGTPSLTLDYGTSAARGDNKAVSNQPDSKYSTEQQKSEFTAPAQKKEKAVKIPNYPNTDKYTNGIEQWETKANGTTDGVSRYNIDADGKARTFFWERRADGSKLANSAAESYVKDGETIHNYYAYQYNAQKQPFLDKNQDRGQIVFHKDGTGFVRTPAGADGNSRFIVFDENKDEISRKTITPATVRNPEAIADLEKTMLANAATSSARSIQTNRDSPVSNGKIYAKQQIEEAVVKAQAETNPIETTDIKTIIAAALAPVLQEPTTKTRSLSAPVNESVATDFPLIAQQKQAEPIRTESTPAGDAITLNAESNNDLKIMTDALGRPTKIDNKKLNITAEFQYEGDDQKAKSARVCDMSSSSPKIHRFTRSADPEKRYSYECADDTGTWLTNESPTMLEGPSALANGAFSFPERISTKTPEGNDITNSFMRTIEPGGTEKRQGELWMVYGVVADYDKSGKVFGVSLPEKNSDKEKTIMRQETDGRGKTKFTLAATTESSSNTKQSISWTLDNKTNKWTLDDKSNAATKLANKHGIPESFYGLGLSNEGTLSFYDTKGTLSKRDFNGDIKKSKSSDDLDKFYTLQLGTQRWEQEKRALQKEMTIRGASNDFVRQVTAAYKNIPEHLREEVKQAGYKFVVAHHLIQDGLRSDLSGQHPRGWPPGTTYAQVDGLQSNAEKAIYVAEFTSEDGKLDGGNSLRTVGLVGHEYSHADDVIWGDGYGSRYSHGAEFAQAYRQDIANMQAKDREKDREDLKYYLQQNLAGEEETFAEAMAISFGGPSNERDLVLFNRNFPAVLNLIKYKLDYKQRLLAQR